MTRSIAAQDLSGKIKHGRSISQSNQKWRYEYGRKDWLHQLWTRDITARPIKIISLYTGHGTILSPGKRRSPKTSTGEPEGNRSCEWPDRSRRLSRDR